jgi:hypothetical protein
METMYEKLINRAKEKHGVIFPCTIGHSWHDAFTIWENNLLFWYNDEDNSTHVESLEIKEA